MHSETYALNLFHFKVYFCYGNIFFIKLHIVVFLVFVFSYFKQVKEKQVFFFLFTSTIIRPTQFRCELTNLLSQNCILKKMRGRFYSI